MFSNTARLARAGLATSKRATVAGFRPFSSVPINKVARVVRFELNGEEEAAVKADAVINNCVKVFEGSESPKGYVETQRMLCKGEWVYEIAIIFDSLDNFKAYAGSDLQKSTFASASDELKSVIKGDIYEGARVYDVL